MSNMPGWMASLSDDEVSNVSEEMSRVISSVADRVHYAEGRRNNFAVIAAGLFAGAIALASMSVQSSFGWIGWSLTVLAAGFFFLSLLLFYIYSAQVNRYPWTSATKTWKWFYRDALPDEKAFNHDLGRWLFAWSKEVKRARVQFANQLPVFAENLHLVADARESLWQDVQQLYVLHINEKYKNSYLSELRRILSVGLALIVVVALAALPIQYLLSGKDPGVLRERVQDVPVKLSWVRYEGAVCSKDCWILTARVSNKSSSRMLVFFEGLGEKCHELPGPSALSPFVVESRSVKSISAYVVCDHAGPVRLKPMARTYEK